MALVALASGVAALTLFVAGIAFVIVRTRELLRGFRSFARSVNVAVSRLEDATRRLADEGEGDSAARLSTSMDRLSVSRARLGVLLAALGDVRASVTRLTAVVPRK